MSSETFANFYGIFPKSVNEIDQLVGEWEICHIFYSSLDTKNKNSTKLKNSYNIKDVNSLER